jgi:hypothetical protein
MAQQCEFSIPPNIRFGMTTHVNSSALQLVTVYVDDQKQGEFGGSGTEHRLLSDLLLNSGQGKIKVTVSANGKLSDLTLSRSVLGDKLNAITIGAEDSSDADYNDVLIDIKYPLG